MAPGLRSGPPRRPPEVIGFIVVTAPPAGAPAKNRGGNERESGPRA